MAKYKKVLVVDDEKVRFDALLKEGIIPPNSVFADSAISGINKIADEGPWDEIMLDHDLNTVVQTPYPREITGQDVAKVLVNQSWKPDLVIVHSLNGPGADRMMDILKDAGINAKRLPITRILSPSVLFGDGVDNSPN